MDAIATAGRKSVREFPFALEARRPDTAGELVIDLSTKCSVEKQYQKNT